MTTFAKSCIVILFISVLMVIFPFIIFSPLSEIHLRKEDNLNDIGCDHVISHSSHSSTKRIWSLFSFNGEEVVLLTRLYELREVVDYFVVYESNWSWSKYQNKMNYTKQIYLDLNNNSNKFTKLLSSFKHQIIHCILPPFHSLSLSEQTFLGPFGANPYRESFRNMMIPQLIKLLNDKTSDYAHIKPPSPDDLIYGSDLDELINANELAPFKHCNRTNKQWPIFFQLKRYHFTFCEDEFGPKRNYFSTLIPFKFLMGSNSKQCPDVIASNISSVVHKELCLKHCEKAPRNRWYKKHCPLIHDGGWEISTMGNHDIIQHKLKHHGDYRGDVGAHRVRWECSFAEHCNNSVSWFDRLISLCPNRNNKSDYYPWYMVDQACKNNSVYLPFWPKPHDLDYLCPSKFKNN
eukprot:452575_1